MRRPPRPKGPADRWRGVMASRSGETRPQAIFGATSRPRASRSRCRSPRWTSRPGSAALSEPAGEPHGVAAGERALLVAEDARGLCGIVQLLLDQPENQPHRAELSKMLVHRRARRQGLGAALMRAAEATARECGKTLLVLDTANGEAERLYERLGWTRVGVIPGYALLPHGGLCGTTVYSRNLGG